MSKALKVIGTIAGAVALVAGTIATAGLGSPALVAAMGSIATYSGLAAGFATIGAQALYKPPPVRGSVTQVLIGVDPPAPYAMGEGYYAGVMRCDTSGYGATLKKVPRPYRWIVNVYSTGGPVHSIAPRVELGTVSSWYNGFLYTDTQLGACPEPSALAPQFAAAPGWTSTAKLSGLAAIGFNLKFDKEGKVFASGVPRLGAYGKWVKVYDPRKDSTFPGGSGSHRLGVESTYEWSENPALHAGTYAYGRYQNGKRVFGIGMPAEGVDWVALAGWANVCDANAWTIFGVIYEPGDRWENLKEICAAGGCAPLFAGGRIGFHYSAPKVALATITDADIAGDPVSVTAMASWRDRMNSIRPKYRSAAHDWEMITADAVTVDSFVTDDGELKQVEWPFNLVKKGDQAAQLGTYKLWDSRELQPIVIPCLPHMRRFRPGECLHVDLPEVNLDTDVVILSRDFDPARMVVTFTVMGETPEKHPYALGRTATPPPTPALKQTTEESDRLRWAVQLDRGVSTVQPNAPATELSAGGDLWTDPTGRIWKRVDEIELSIGGDPIEIGGEPVSITWTENPTQPLITATEAAMALAQDAQATADGKVELYYQSTTPTASGARDMWFKLDSRKWYVAAAAGANSVAPGAWELAEDQDIGTALTAAAGAQATADGKVATFYGESEPTPEGIGDLWFKPSTKALTRWTGATWEAVAAAGVEDGADVTSTITGLAEIVLDADYTGAITTFLPKVQPYTLLRNGVDVTASATWSVTILTGTIAASFTSAGVLSIDKSGGALTPSTMRIRAVYGGYTREFDVKVTKQNALPPSGGDGSGGTSSKPVSGSLLTTTPTAITGDIDVTVGASGKVDLSCSYQYTTDATTGTQSMATQWYEWNGSAFVAISGTAVTAYSANSPAMGESGLGDNSHSQTGLTPGSTKKYRLYGWNTGGGTGVWRRYVGGSANAVSS